MRIIRYAGRALGTAFVTSALTVLALFLVNFALSFLDRDIFRDRAIRAVNSNVLIERASFPLASVGAYRYDPNDCLILTMLASRPSGNRLESSVSPVTPTFQAPPNFRAVGFDVSRRESRAQALERKTPRYEHCALLLEELQPTGEPRAYYHRYVHGSWVLSGLILSIFEFQTATDLLRIVAIALPIALLIAIARSKGMTEGRRAQFVAMAVFYLLFSGVTFFAWKLALAPAEIILSSLLAVAFFFPLGKQPTKRIILIGSLYGALCASFEFLTGLLPSALALLVGLFAVDRDPHEEVDLRNAILAAVSFAFAAVFCLALKATAVALIWGPSEILAAGATLTGHFSATGWMNNPSARPIYSALSNFGEGFANSRLAAVVFAFGKLAYFSDLVALGSRPLGLVITILGPALFAALAILRLVRPSKSVPRSAAALALISCSVIFGWVFLMVEHTIVNAVWMQRMLPWLSCLLIGGMFRMTVQKSEQSASLRPMH